MPEDEDAKSLMASDKPLQLSFIMMRTDQIFQIVATTHPHPTHLLRRKGK
jgi:hypothetical protein